MKDGLTTDEVLALPGFEIEDSGDEASDGKTWLYSCGACLHWFRHVNHLPDHDFPLCDRCKAGMESFENWRPPIR